MVPCRHVLVARVSNVRHQHVLVPSFGFRNFQLSYFGSWGFGDVVMSGFVDGYMSMAVGRALGSTVRQLRMRSLDLSLTGSQAGDGNSYAPCMFRV